VTLNKETFTLSVQHSKSDKLHCRGIQTFLPIRLSDQSTTDSARLKAC
jgi:hypothetical protein